MADLASSGKAVSTEINKTLKEFFKKTIKIDSKIDGVNRVELLQKEITKLVNENNKIKEQFPKKNFPPEIILIVKDNNRRIKEKQEERDDLYKSAKDQLKNNILKNNSPTSDNESS